MKSLLFLFFAIQSTHAQTGQCSCEAVQVNNTNIREYIRSSSPFYKTLVAASLSNPILNVNGCSGEMHCDAGTDLLVFDNTGLGKKFKSTTALGTCFPTNQTWKVDTGNPTSFNQLYGTCVAQRACSCPILLLNQTTIRDYVDDTDLFYADLTAESVTVPTRSGSCDTILSCSEGYSLVIFDKIGLGITFERGSANAKCDSSKWKVETGSRVGPTVFQDIYAICLANGDSPNSSASTTAPTSTTKDRNITCVPSFATFAFLYSNDFNASVVNRTLSQVYKPWGVHLNEYFPNFVNLRFDLRDEEEFVYYTYWDYSRNPAAYLRLPDPSLPSVEGSDILKQIERFIDTIDTPLCNSKIYALVKRAPSTNDTARLVQKLRRYNIDLMVTQSTDLKGEKNRDVMYKLTTKTNGICRIADESEFGLYIPAIAGPREYMAHPIVSGTGSMELPLPAFPFPGSYGMAYNFEMTIEDSEMRNLFRSVSLFVTYIGTDERASFLNAIAANPGPWDYGNMIARDFYAWSDVEKFHLAYEYLREEIKQTLQIRFSRSASAFNFLPYDD